MRVCNYMYVRKALILRQVTIHCLIMWRAVKQLRGRYKDSKMSGEKNHTIDAQESLSVTESLNLCKKLLEHGWMSAQSGKVPWNDARNTGLDGCMGLVKMSSDRHFQDLSRESNLWFVLFLTMSGISLVAVLALVYLINTMRRSISLKKCLLASGENQVKRQDPKSRSFRFPVGTRPKVQTGASSPQQPFLFQSGFQPQTTPDSPGQQQHQIGYTIPPHKYPISVSTVSASQTSDKDSQVSVRTSNQEETKIVQAKMKAEMEAKYMEYQRSLWELQKAVPNGALGAPDTIYPALPGSTEGEGSS